MAKKVVKVKASIRKGRAVRAYTKIIDLPTFINTSKVSYPSSKQRWDKDGNALIDITVTNPDLGFKFVHKNAKAEDYIKTNGRAPYQIKETVYNKKLKTK